MSTTQAQPDPADPVTLHHVALYVSDLDRTRTFYCDVLGMHEISRPADSSFRGPTSSAVPPRCTSLWKPLPAAPPSCAHPGLQTNYEPATASILRSRSRRWTPTATSSPAAVSLPWAVLGSALTTSSRFTSPTLTDTSSSSSAGSTSQSPISAEPSWQPAVKVSPSRPTPDAETTSAYLASTSDLQEQSRPVDRRLSCCLHVTSVLILVCWPVP